MNEKQTNQHKHTHTVIHLQPYTEGRRRKKTTSDGQPQSGPCENEVHFPSTMTLALVVQL